MFTIKQFLLLFLVAVSVQVLSGCSSSEYEDVSDKPGYSHLLGAKLEFLEEMPVHGVTRDKDYGDTIDVYVVTGSPGFSGREVLSKESLPVGTISQVKKVLECTSCWYEKISYEVEISSPGVDYEKPVYLTDLGGASA